MDKEDKIYVAGHTGLVGSAIVRKLRSEHYDNLIMRRSSEVDLRSQSQTNEFISKEKPDIVFLAAAKVGGILANRDYPADFIYDNIMIQSNVIKAAFENDVSKLVFLGSSCVYPKYPEIPISEDQLLTGKLEPTNEAYAIAKIAGIKMIEYFNKQYGTDYISLMPTNLYGPNDNYHPTNSHVLAALIRKFVIAEKNNTLEVTLWGTGDPKREFLHVDDLADASLFLANSYSGDQLINVGSGKEISINELAKIIAELADFQGEIVHDLSKPDGTPRKVMDVTKLNKLGWKPKISLKEGIRLTIKDFKNNYEKYIQ